MNPTVSLQKIEYHTVPILEERIRLSDYIPGKFKSITSHKGMKNAIKKGLVTINGNIGYTGDFIEGGEIIELYQDPHKKLKPIIEIDLEVLYEDDYLAVINKPAGIEVSGNKRWTLENALIPNLKKSQQEDALLRPEPIHRLDYPTSGVILIGKTTKAVMRLNKMFEERELTKIYYAVTIKSVKNEGVIKSDIDGKPAKTFYSLKQKIESTKFEFINLVELNPHTGRRHQLRKHLSEMGNPILGDRDYGIEGLVLKGKGLYLHAYSLEFTHPLSGEKIKIAAPFPKKFIKLFPNIQ